MPKPWPYSRPILESQRPKVHTAYHNLTLRDLLCHVSGLDELHLILEADLLDSKFLADIVVILTGCCITGNVANHTWRGREIGFWCLLKEPDMSPMLVQLVGLKPGSVKAGHHRLDGWGTSKTLHCNIRPSSNCLPVVSLV